VTMKYCHPTPENMQRAVDMLGSTINYAIASGQKAANFEPKVSASGSVIQAYQSN
jgi:hypothetical protein